MVWSPPDGPNGFHAEEETHSDDALPPPSPRSPPTRREATKEEEGSGNTSKNESNVMAVAGVGDVVGDGKNARGPFCVKVRSVSSPGVVDSVTRRSARDRRFKNSPPTSPPPSNVTVPAVASFCGRRIDDDNKGACTDGGTLKIVGKRADGGDKIAESSMKKVEDREGSLDRAAPLVATDRERLRRRSSMRCSATSTAQRVCC